MTLRDLSEWEGRDGDAESTHTWAHVTRRSAPPPRYLARGSKTKVGEEDIDISAVRRHEDVLRLEVPVINATCVAILERVNDLDEDTLDEFILAKERGLLHDRVKVAGTEIVDVEDVKALLELTMEGEDVGVGRDTSMELFLATVISLGDLLHDALDGVVHAGMGVDGVVDNAICPCTQDGLNPEGTIIDCLPHGRGCRGGRRSHGCRGGG
jgi:hypothetical protein